MSIAAAHATSFYREVAKAQIVWSIQDSAGFPAPMTPEGKRSMPFWSSHSRAEKIVQSVAAYAGFEVVAIPWSDFCEAWVPGLTSDGILAGVNWSGTNAMGYDLEPSALQRSVEALIRGGAFKPHFQSMTTRHDQ
jgi:hypothetical protein